MSMDLLSMETHSSLHCLSYARPLSMSLCMRVSHLVHCVSWVVESHGKHHKQTLTPLCVHSSRDTCSFIGSHVPSRLMPYDCSPKYACSFGSTYGHVPRSRGTPLHPSSPTLILSDKLLGTKGSHTPTDQSLGWQARTHASKLPSNNS